MVKRALNVLYLGEFFKGKGVEERGERKRRELKGGEGCSLQLDPAVEEGKGREKVKQQSLAGVFRHFSLSTYW